MHLRNLWQIKHRWTHFQSQNTFKKQHPKGKWSTTNLLEMSSLSGRASIMNQSPHRPSSTVLILILFCISYTKNIFDMLCEWVIYFPKIMLFPGMGRCSHVHINHILAFCFFFGIILLWIKNTSGKIMWQEVLYILIYGRYFFIINLFSEIGTCLTYEMYCMKSVPFPQATPNKAFS